MVTFARTEGRTTVPRVGGGRARELVNGDSAGPGGEGPGDGRR